MKDYEILHIPNSQLPNIGLLHLTVSENRVGLRMTVLDALGRPDGIIIRRGIKANEGKLVIEAAEYAPDNYYDGVIPIDYERTRIGFHNVTVQSTPNNTPTAPPRKAATMASKEETP